MAAGMEIWAVRALVLDGGVDEAIARTEVRNRVEALDEEMVRGLIAGPWLPGIEHGFEMIDVLTADWSSPDYQHEVIAQVKRAIVNVAVEIFFGGEHADRCRFVDSGGETWIMSGGIADSVVPTESCHMIGMLSDIALSSQPISKPTRGNKLCCPDCGGTSAIVSIEAVPGDCAIVIDVADGEWSFGGDTEMRWDGTATVGWACRSCDWQTRNAEWIERFADSGASRSERQRMAAIQRQGHGQ